MWGAVLSVPGAILGGAVWAGLKINGWVNDIRGGPLTTSNPNAANNSTPIKQSDFGFSWGALLKVGFVMVLGLVGFRLMEKGLKHLKKVF